MMRPWHTVRVSCLSPIVETALLTGGVHGGWPHIFCEKGGQGVHSVQEKQLLAFEHLSHREHAS